MEQSSVDIAAYVADVGRRARAASREMARAPCAAKDRALLATAAAIRREAAALQLANARDLDAARRAGQDKAFVDRLALDARVIEAMALGLEQIVMLPDPIGEMSDLRMRPSGIQVGRMRVPLGVIGIIYESRPNVTIDAAGLCIKSGNVALLRGSASAKHTNAALSAAVRGGLADAGLPEDIVIPIEGSRDMPRRQRFRRG
jgi:glutamate-5-semialdehyde dehydrogenase